MGLRNVIEVKPGDSREPLCSSYLRGRCPKYVRLGPEKAGFGPLKAFLSHAEAGLGHSGSLKLLKG